MNLSAYCQSSSGNEVGVIVCMLWLMILNPSTLVSDQDRISPYNIKQTSDENKEKYQLEVISWFNTKFFKLTSQELYGRQQGELTMRSWELKGLQMLLVYFVCYKDDICKSYLLPVMKSLRLWTKRFNSLTPMSDQYRISPNNTNTMPSRQVMRMKKNIS